MVGSAFKWIYYREGVSRKQSSIHVRPRGTDVKLWFLVEGLIRLEEDHPYQLSQKS